MHIGTKLNTTLRYLFVLLLLAFFVQCTSDKQPIEEQRLELIFADSAVMSVEFNMIDSFHFTVSNCDEIINIEDVQYREDSIFFSMPVFGTEFKGVRKVDAIEGQWHNYLKSDLYTIPFSVRPYKNEVKEEIPKDFSGRYKCTFVDPDGIETPAIGIFKQTENKVCGTFHTETGDYRYLSGEVNGNVMTLSTFDGSHAFWFRATMSDSGSITGDFRSGTHWHETWHGALNDEFVLRDMKGLTWLKEGYDSLEFKLKDTEQIERSLDDSMYQNKVVIVQIMGSWCPNCMDESRFLQGLYTKYQQGGLEIIGLDFEPDTSFNYFYSRVQKFKIDLGLSYPILNAGFSNKSKAQEALPMLNKIISYPTAIIINRQGEIEEIHTGFSGPGTGEVYLNYCRETEKLIQALLK
jgi:thiol-disulfide isomerase/thioredoxin